MRHALAKACLLAILLTLAAGEARAQLLVEREIDLGTLEAGALREHALAAENPTARTFVVLAEAAPAEHAELSITPGRARLEANASATFTIGLRVAGDAPAGTHEARVLLTVVDVHDASTRQDTILLTFGVERRVAYLDLAPIPFPAGVDARIGTLALEAATWLLAAALLAWAGHRARRAHRGAPGRVAAKASGAAALLVLTLGGIHALRLAEGRTAAFVRAGLTLLAIIVGAILAKRTLSALVASAMARAEARGRAGAERALPILEKVLAVAVTLIALAVGLQTLGIDVGFLLAGGVVVGLVLSLAAQDTLSNLFSGFFILVDRPFREGDEIRLVTGEICRVDRIGLRSTRLYHFRHEQEMIVPNNELATKSITNLSYPDSTYRLALRIDVASNTDLRRARELLVEAARSVEGVLDGPGREPVVWVRAFGEYGIELQLRVYVPSSRHRNPVRTGLIIAVKEAFDAAQITIPVPQREIRLRHAPEPDDE